MHLMIAGALFLLASFGSAAPTANLQDQDRNRAAGDPPEIELHITDLTPRFITFYEAALAEEADEARRWELWKKHYDFAALPPVPERDSLAREMLASAWPHYPQVIEQIREGAEAIRPLADSLLRVVATHLEADGPIRLDLLVFVGNLEGGAYFAADRGRLMVAVPIEEPAAQRGHAFVHEFTHAVHHRLAGLSEGWEVSIARRLLSEGLANRMEQVVFPGRPEAEYVEHRPGWFAEAEARSADILRGVQPYLRDSSSEQAMRFTFGSGTTGLEREAYYAGWVVVGHLLERGHTFATLARVPEERIPALVEQAIHELTSGRTAAFPRPNLSSLTHSWLPARYALTRWRIHR